MKIALLVCDHVLPQLQEKHGGYPEMFDALFPNLPFESRFVCDDDFPDIDEYDAYIISGSKHSVYENIDWINRLADFTRELFHKQKRVLGVCFGHQMIAHALGGKVERSENGFYPGNNEFQVLRRESWMEGLPNSYRMMTMCQDQVSQLPQDAEVLSNSEGCPVGIFALGPEFLGIQGHPEFTPAYLQDLMESRTENIGDQKVADAIKSLEIETHGSLLGKTLSQFLKATGD